MKNTFLILFALIIANISIAQEKKAGIEFFQGSFDEAIAMAKAKQKPIFLDAYASWCGPCKQMAKKVFTDATIAKHYNDNFINLKIDMEKGEGIDLAKKFKVKGYPTLLYIGTDGELTHRTIGYRTSEEFLKDASNAKNKDFQYVALKNKYEAKKASQDDLYNYVYAAGNAGYDNVELLQAYYATIKDPKTAMTDKNMQLVYDWDNDLDSKAIQMIMKNPESFVKKFGKEKVAKKQERIIYNETVEAAQTGNRTWKELSNIIKNNAGNKAGMLSSKYKVTYYKAKQDWENYALAAIDYVDNQMIKDPNTLNSIAWTFYESVENKDALKKGMEYAKYASDAEPSYAILDTYAAITHKYGDNKTAKTIAEKAIKVAKEEDSSYDETVDLLEAINLALESK